MSSEGNHPKRRKCHDLGDGNGSNDADAPSSPEEAMAMDEMRAKMERMKNQYEREIESMKERLSHVESMGQMAAKELSDSEGKCASLYRSVKLLARESNWNYSAPEIPPSHWIEQGHDVDHTELMQHFVSGMKETTCALRRAAARGKCQDEDIMLGGYMLDGEEDSRGDIPSQLVKVLHNDLLLPHWLELSNAVQVSTFSRNTFSISGVELPFGVIQMLTPALTSKEFEVFSLQGNDFDEKGRRGINFAVEIINHNPWLKKFRWMDNSISNMNDMNRLLECISRSHSIEKIVLRNFCGEGVNGSEVLCSLLRDAAWNIRSIDLRSSGIGNIEQSRTSEYLAANPPLQHLLLSDNNLNDKDAALLATALKENTILSELNLEGNAFTEDGLDTLLRAVFDATSLNAMANTNHTCILRIDGSESDLAQINCIHEHGMNTEIRMRNRAHKIFCLLLDRNELDSELGEDNSLRLVPMVLSCVQKYWARDRDSWDNAEPLSITYKLLRGWKVPELFEQRHV